MICSAVVTEREGSKVSSSLLALLAWIIGCFHFLTMWTPHFCSWREFYTKYILYFLLWTNLIHQLNDSFGCQICVQILLSEDQGWCFESWPWFFSDHLRLQGERTWLWAFSGCTEMESCCSWNLLLFLGLSRCAEYICSALSASINKILLCAPALLTFICSLLFTGNERQKCLASKFLRSMKSHNVS